MMDAPVLITNASVVSHESVRIALTLAALNGLQVKTADIENAYLQVPVTENIWCKLGSEFGSNEGKPAIIEVCWSLLLKPSCGLHVTFGMAIM